MNTPQSLPLCCWEMLGDWHRGWGWGACGEEREEERKEGRKEGRKGGRGGMEGETCEVVVRGIVTLSWVFLGLPAYQFASLSLSTPRSRRILSLFTYISFSRSQFSRSLAFPRPLSPPSSLHLPSPINLLHLTPHLSPPRPCSTPSFHPFNAPPTSVPSRPYPAPSPFYSCARPRCIA